MSTNIPSFEEVDKLIQKADLSAFKRTAGKRGAARGAAKGATAAAAAPNICEIYKVIRPILLLVMGTPFIPAKWKDAIRAFISAMDMFCPQG